MDALITDSLVITCDASRRVIEHGAVAVRGGRIAAVGPSSELEQRYAELPRISGRGLAALPGFINAHTHTALTVLRGSIEDFDGDVIYGYMSPVSYTMSGEERAVMVQLGCLEALRSGCTTLVDPFRHVPTYGRQMAATGMRLWLSENCADINTLNIRKGDYSVDRAFGQVFLDRTVEMIETLHDTHGGRVKCQIAAHAPDNCSPWMLSELKTLAQCYRLTRTVHLAQSMQEVKVVREARGGRTPAEYLDSEGWLAPDLVGAHWTFCTEKDIELLASRGVQMVHCPANSSRRGPHRVLIGRIQDAGINIALGTDNMTEDIFHAMKIGLILARGGRGREREGGCDPLPQTLLDGITRNAARSVGAEAEIGSIEPGKKADLTLIDLDVPAMRPLINPVSTLVHYGHPGIVHSVIVDGDFLLRERKVLAFDERALLREAQAVTQAVWTRMLAANPDIPPPPGGLAWLDA